MIEKATAPELRQPDMESAGLIKMEIDKNADK